MSAAEAGGAMVVEVRLFAILRERAGQDRVQLTLPETASVADALRSLGELPALSELLERLPVRLAVNRDYATPETFLHPGDELALIPPLSGGAKPLIHVRLTEEPLSLDSLSRAVADSRAGAIVTFQGVTREVERLHYEAYTEMACERITQIARECMDTHELWAVAVEHRLGSVPLGESSVIVAVSAAHRGEAFAGAREMIDRVKGEAPIWKREHSDGAPGHWVEGTVPSR